MIKWENSSILYQYIQLEFFKNQLFLVKDFNAVFLLY